MIESSDAYKAAVIGTSRRVHLRINIDISDPDIVYTNVSATSESSVSKKEQLHDKNFDNPDYYATLEHNRWLLNGLAEIYPAPESSNQGFIGKIFSDNNGSFPQAQVIVLSFTDCSIMQGCTIQFPENDYDGIPSDFSVEIEQGGIIYYSQSFTDNTESKVVLSGFTVYAPDKITLTVTKMQLPGRRLRVVEIFPGIYEEWTEKNISSFSITHQGDVSCLSLPYGSCDMTIDNLNRRFLPRNKDGIFQSIEERQQIKTSIGVVLPDGTTEYKPTGVFYQYSEGWKTGKNGMLISWSLVDIIGLLSNREYNPPTSLPTTLDGWIKSIVSQLGVNFENLYSIDSSYRNISLTVPSVESVTGKKCGDILLFVCMTTGTWPRADAETGLLTVEPLWNTGNTITLDNMTDYPEVSDNQDIAAIFFTIDGTKKFVASGNSTSSDVTSSIDNPFISDSNKANAAARGILINYGGNKYTLTGRGDPSCEIGDLQTIWLDKSNAVAARIIEQEFSMTSGVLKDCKMTLIQPDGVFMYENRVVITENTTWTAPDGVSHIRVILVGGGGGGTDGEDGNYDSAGADGISGQGGKVWTGDFNINNQQQFQVTIGLGGGKGQLGTATTFWNYSSANGQDYNPNYIDTASGEVYARDGVPVPIEHTGDGGAGGKGGTKGERHEKSYTDSEGNIHTYYVIDSYPGDGTDGVPGVSGCAIIYWDKE